MRCAPNTMKFVDCKDTIGWIHLLTGVGYQVSKVLSKIYLQGRFRYDGVQYDGQ